jgi:hypothetical protein
MAVELGWPLPKRLQLIEEQIARATDTHRLEVTDGRISALKIVTVPNGLPRYRLENGRTASLQREYLATHPDLEKSFFSGDPERESVQAVQHELLLNLIKGAGLLAYFEDISHRQVDPIVLDHRGYVINGNRRLCCWRVLHERDAAKYAHFSHVDAVVLPPLDDAAVDKLEARLQIEPDIRDEYTWDAKANMLYDRQQIHGLRTAELASLYNYRESQVKQYLDMREYAITYLKSRGAAERWSRVSDKEFAFKKIVEKRRGLTSEATRRLFEEAAFVLLDDPEGGRLYDSIPQLAVHIDTIRDRLGREFEPVRAFVTSRVSEPSPSSADDFFTSNDVPPDASDVDLANVIAAPENRVRAAEVLKDVIEGAQALERERGSAEYVLKRLQRANTEIQQAINGIQDSSSRDGVPEQLNQIEAGLRRLKEWLGVRRPAD